MRVLSWKSWQPLALIVIGAFIPHLVISDSCGELLIGGPSP
jgi:hypothetical protein